MHRGPAQHSRVAPRDARIPSSNAGERGPRANAECGNSIELRMVQIHPRVSEIWVPQSLSQVLPDLTSFWPMGKPIYRANGQITMTVHNYRSRQVHETLNGVNPSSGFRDMRSAKSGPNLCQIWQVFGPWASSYGANGQMTMLVHNYKPRQFHRTSNGENPSSGYRDMGSASLAAARQAARPPARPPTRPDRDNNTPPARRAER